MQAASVLSMNQALGRFSLKSIEIFNITPQGGVCGYLNAFHPSFSCSL